MELGAPWGNSWATLCLESKFYVYQELILVVRAQSRVVLVRAPQMSPITSSDAYSQQLCHRIP